MGCWKLGLVAALGVPSKWTGMMCSCAGVEGVLMGMDVGAVLLGGESLSMVIGMMRSRGRCCGCCAVWTLMGMSRTCGDWGCACGRVGCILIG